MLLIITNREDLTSDYVVLRLRELYIPFFRFNVDEFPSECEVSRKYFHNGLSGSINRSHNSIDLEKITVVWYRRPLLPTNINAFNNEVIPYVRHESRNFLEGIFLSLNVPWVNPITAVYNAERKIYQLRLATYCGLKIPETIISNSVNDLSAFVQEYSDVICKPIYSGLLITQTCNYSVYTNPFNSSHLNDIVAVRNCPTLLQRRIEKDSDIRVTFFGDTYFAVSIRGTNNSPLDWRKPGLAIEYEQIQLSDEIVNSCKMMLNKLDLVYGAFDFVLDTEGNIFFLEINPAGEWAWLDKELKLNMRDELISLFDNLKGSSKWTK